MYHGFSCLKCNMKRVTLEVTNDLRSKELIETPTHYWTSVPRCPSYRGGQSWVVGPHGKMSGSTPCRTYAQWNPHRANFISICLFVRLFIRPSVRPFVCLINDHPFIRYPYICSSIHPTVHLSLYPFVHLFVLLSINPLQ
jgi:hypothetical protein